MRTHVRLPAIVVTSVLAATCGGGTPVPTSPSGQQSFLTGTWTGTLTIDREGEASTSGNVSWTFAPVDGTNLQTFSVTIRSQNPWLTTTATVTSAITPSNQPPARISTTGSYPSPRGCTGTMPTSLVSIVRRWRNRHSAATSCCQNRGLRRVYRPWRAADVPSNGLSQG